MTLDRARRLRFSVAQAVLGSAAVFGLTWLCERLQLDVATTAMVNLIAVVLLSLGGSFAASAIAALAAALSLHFFFVVPRDTWGLGDPVDLVALAAFLFTALVISRLLSRVRASLDEAERARRELRTAIDTIPALVWTTLPDGTGELSNARWLEFTGLSSEEAQGRGYASALHPEDYGRLAPKWAASFRSGEPIEDETRLRAADGSYRWFLHRAVPLRDERGNIVKWYGTSVDIEDRRRAKELLRERANLLDLTHDTIFVRDLNDVITYWNRGAEKLYGWSPEEAVGQVSHTLMETMFPIPLQEITATLFATGRWEGELIHITRGRRRVAVASRWSLQRDEHGHPVAILETNNDITQRKRAEDELRRSQAYLAEAQRLSHTGSFGWDTATGALAWSDETFRIFGYDRATMPAPTVQDAFRRVHPDDLAALEQFVQRVSGEGTDWELDHRLLMPDGSVKYVHLVARASRTEGGDLEYVGAIQDVTAVRQAQAELRRSEAYLAEAQRLSHTGSWARNLRQPELSYRSAETWRIFGVDPAGMSVPDRELEKMVHPDDRPRLTEVTQTAIRDKTAYETEVRVVHTDGSIRHVYLTGHPVLDPAGEVVELVGTLMDVTERKRTERALRRARERALKARFAAALDERTRLAREIHDTLIQGFTGIALKLVAATNRLAGPPETVAFLRDVVTLAQKTLVDARSAVWDLRTPSSGEADFPTALRYAAEDCTRGTDLRLMYEVEGVPRPPHPDVEGAALRVMQEAITNAVKHAAASTVRVRVTFGERGLRLSVTDDGRGFDMESNLHAFGGHWGLLGMRERANQIQGQLRVRSAPGQGTKVVLWAPYAVRAGTPLPSGDPVVSTAATS